MNDRGHALEQPRRFGAQTEFAQAAKRGAQKRFEVARRQVASLSAQKAVESANEILHLFLLVIMRRQEEALFEQQCHSDRVLGFCQRLLDLI